MFVPRKRAAAALGVLGLAGCGSSSTHATSATKPTTTTTTAAAVATTGPPPAVDQLAAAERPTAGAFPAVRGRTLQQLANTVRSTATLSAATGVFTPGTRRYGFGMTLRSGAFIYAPTALYIGRTPGSEARGPYLAPADPTTVAPPYRSKQNSGPGGIQAIYAAQLPLPRAGTYAILALTRTPRGITGATGEVAVAASSPIPNVGQRPPAIATDTHGAISYLTTRVPPENMHSVSLSQALGHRPVALLFSTPQLCTSRVCGPVTDVAVELQHQFGHRIAFIHEEVYVNNNPKQGLRSQLKAFHLQTEPWLFVLNRRGVIVARFEGAFGTNELRAALEEALR
jgi:hypothetical protein